MALGFAIAGAVKKAFGLAGKGFIKGTLGGGGRRILIGTTIGALYGGITSEEGSQMGRLGDILGGATIGAGLGFATTGAAFKAIKNIGMETLRYGPKASYGLGKRVASIGMGISRFALNRPKTAAMIGLGGLGMYGLATSGYGEAGGNNEAMMMMAESRNLPSTSPGGDIGYLNAGGYGMNPINMTRAGRVYSNFMNSTDGLTLGLHNSRHR